MAVCEERSVSTRSPNHGRLRDGRVGIKTTGTHPHYHVSIIAVVIDPVLYMSTVVVAHWFNISIGSERYSFSSMA